MALRIPASMTMECKKALGTYVPFCFHQHATKIRGRLQEETTMQLNNELGNKTSVGPGYLTTEYVTIFNGICRDMLLEPKIRNVIDSDDGEKSKRLVLLNLDIQTEGR